MCRLEKCELLEGVLSIASKDRALFCVLSLAEKHLPSCMALHTQTVKSIGKSLDEDGLGV